MAVTQKQIAQELGVSRQLVSYALTNTGTISADMKERILEAAQDMGYRRNAMAVAVRNGNFGSVTLLLSSHPHASTLPSRVLDSILAELEEHGVHLIIHRLPMATLADPQRLPKVLREWMCDGLLIDVTHAIPPHMTEAIQKSELPAIWLNVPRKFDTVRPDDYEAGRLAARHLIELGHRRICYLDLSHTWADVRAEGMESLDHYSSHDRYAGVRDEIEASGCELILRLRHEQNESRDRGNIYNMLYSEVRRILTEDKPTAIISYDEVEFVPLIVARDLGLNFPRDLSLVTFGSAPHWFMGEQITTLVAPEREIGRRMAKLLLEKIAGSSSPIPTIAMPFHLDQGVTSGPVPTVN